MTNVVAEILSREARQWRRADPAYTDQIAALLESSDFDWPTALLDLWRFSNGGEGDLALPPMWFVLFTTEEVARLKEDEVFKEFQSIFQFFGSNGGLESVAFDLRSPTRPIVMIDLIAGAKSAVEIAGDAWEFVNAIGLEYSENA